MLRPAHGSVTSLVERYRARQERKFLREIASVMQFGNLVVEGQLICAPCLEIAGPREPTTSQANTGKRDAAPGLHAHAALPLI
jgi:hypothetical protein